MARGSGQEIIIILRVETGRVVWEVFEISVAGRVGKFSNITDRYGSPSPYPTREK